MAQKPWPAARHASSHTLISCLYEEFIKSTLGYPAMAAVTLCAYGRTVKLVGPDKVVGLALKLLPSTYGPTESAPERTWTAGVRDDEQLSVLVERTELGSYADASAATEALLADLELWVAEHAQGAVFVHAGCAVADGRAIVIPGYTWFGKTSLVAALVRAGADYYSDEYAVLDDRGLVHPYPRSLRVRSRVGGTTERVPVAELGGTTGHGPAQVGLIAAVRYDGETGWDVAPVSRSQAALQLLTHTVGAQSSPEVALHAIQGATEGALAVVGVRGEADEAASTLLEMLDGLPSSRGGDSSGGNCT